MQPLNATAGLGCMPEDCSMERVVCLQVVSLRSCCGQGQRWAMGLQALAVLQVRQDWETEHAMRW